MISNGRSFKGWELFEFVKGRKKMVVTLVSAGLAYFISDSITIATVSGAIVEGIFALIEYYMKEYR